MIDSAILIFNLAHLTKAKKESEKLDKKKLKYL